MPKSTKDIEQMLEELKEEMLEKEQGFSAVMPIDTGGDGRPPKLEIVLLDPEDEEVAYRRVDDPFDDDEKGSWSIGEIDEAIEEALAWQTELEESAEAEEEMEFDE